MSWDNAGELLYLAENKNIYVYDPLFNMIMPLDHEPINRNIEAVEMLPDMDELLLLGVQYLNDLLMLDIDTGNVDPLGTHLGDYDDIEALAACPYVE